MRKLLTIAAVLLVVTLIAAPSRAQVVANDAYQVDYFSKFGFLHVMRIINTGQVGSPIDSTTKHGTVCANIYAFDANQEMISCCSCPITANGMISFFTFGPGASAPPVTDFALMGIPPESGVIKVVVDAVTPCDPRTITSPINGALRAFGTQLGGPASCNLTPGGFACQFGPLDGTGTETEFQRAPLTQAEQSFLGNACSFVLYLGSGNGKCLCPFDGT